MLQKIFRQRGLVLLFEPLLFFLFAFRFGQFSDVGLFRRLVRLERRNLFRGRASKLREQHARRQMHREIFGLRLRQRARINTQVVNLPLKQPARVLVPHLQPRGCTKVPAERILCYFRWPHLAIHIELQARGFARPVVVEEHVMRSIHGHAVFGSHFHCGIRPARRQSYKEAKIPQVPPRVRDVVKAKFVAGPVQ